MNIFKTARLVRQPDHEGDALDLAERFGTKGPFTGELGSLAGHDGKAPVVQFFKAIEALGSIRQFLILPLSDDGLPVSHILELLNLEADKGILPHDLTLLAQTGLAIDIRAVIGVTDRNDIRGFSVGAADSTDDGFVQ